MKNITEIDLCEPWIAVTVRVVQMFWSVIPNNMMSTKTSSFRKRGRLDTHCKFECEINLWAIMDNDLILFIYHKHIKKHTYHNKTTIHYILC